MADITSFAAKRNEEYLEATSRFKLDENDFYHGQFPKDFWFGCGTAAYQIEGGWDADGKGPSLWDNLCHKNPKAIEDGTSGDVACDSYHQYKEDVQLLKNMGANMYKFSISWPRVLPEGTVEKINKAGVDYYNDLIDNLLENGIQPLVTIWHWDTPQALAEKYPKFWADENFIDIFVNFARFCFEMFGDRVKHWLTINEPWIATIIGYDLGVHPPNISEPGTTPYLVIHNMIKAHGLTYRIYEKEFRQKHKGRVGLSLDCWGLLPANPESQEDLDATDIAFQFKVYRTSNNLIPSN